MMSVCTKCESVRLIRMVITEAPPNLSPHGIMCLECGQVQGAFPVQAKIPLGSFLAEACDVIMPGDKGKFRLLARIGGVCVEFDKMMEVEAVWHGGEDCEQVQLCELTFFNTIRPMGDLHATHYNADASLESLKEMLALSGGKRIVMVQGGEEPWMGTVILELPDGAAMVKNAEGVSHECTKAMMRDVDSPFATLFNQ